jgi:2-oxoglutarate dehydrogenase E1 component
VIQRGEADQVKADYIERLESNQIVSRPVLEHPQATFVIDWEPYLNQSWDTPADTSIAVPHVERLGLKITEIPEGFEVHRSVKRVYDARREMALGERGMDWGFAETLAYASLLENGHHIRLSGQDSERGTFAHRHASVHNQREPGIHQPLRHIFEGQPNFRVYNSLLSEEAVLAFEYGYSTGEPETLVIWEAQFGDFVNGAQVVIDQFLSSSESKWSRFCGLVMLLPHGYEGQGPEHSSARLERYLQLCAEDNIQVCMPSTPAQMFHMVRRQILRKYRKPLIVMSPKSLLRHRLCTSSREELADHSFEVVIDDAEVKDAKRVTRLVLCSGKVYYDVLEKRRELDLDHVALVRVEQLYPYPRDALQAILDKYDNARDVVWCQEEPRNQGTWFFMLSRRHLAGMISKKRALHYAGRPYSASPAVGYLNVHLEQQRQLVSDALALDELQGLQRIPA